MRMRIVILKEILAKRMKVKAMVKGCVVVVGGGGGGVLEYKW